MLRNFLSRRYPGSASSTESVREFVYTTCQRFIELGFADSDYESNLCCGDEARFWQRFSEALIANELLEAGLDLRPSHEGPDFLVVSGNSLEYHGDVLARANVKNRTIIELPNPFLPPLTPLKRKDLWFDTRMLK